MENNTEHKLITSEYKPLSKEQINLVLFQLSLIKVLSIMLLVLFILQNLLQGR
jgi:hypothetical protein